MRFLSILSATALLSMTAPGVRDVSAQASAETVRARVEAARAAAGSDHQFVFGRLCEGPIEAVGAPPVVGAVPLALPSADPDRDWYAEPVQVFDDLYFLGQTRFSAWALRTSEGIIVVDAIFDYSVEAEVIEGLATLGIDPDEIRYNIISHAHGDHVGGAGILQQHGARVVMSEADWELYENSDADYPKATRDIVATDGMELRLGDHVVRTYLTPGHTHGTISSILPVHDRESAASFREVARTAGADIILSNHTAYDGSTVKLPVLGQRAEGAPHPYVIGVDAVSRYLTVAEECAVAARIAEEAGL
jgi:metallo-beta-lactamase class B